MEVNILWEYSVKMESDKVYTVVEDLCVEDTNVSDSCNQFLNDYQRLHLLNWIIVKIEVVYGVHWDLFGVIYYWVGNPILVVIPSECVYK